MLTPLQTNVIIGSCLGDAHVEQELSPAFPTQPKASGIFKMEAIATASSRAIYKTVCST